MSIDAMADHLQRGDITFADFLRWTTHEWHAIACSLKRKWKLPSCVSTEDLEQELKTGAFLAHERFDPSREVSLGKYLLFNAFDRAKKWMQKQIFGKRPHRDAEAVMPRWIENRTEHLPSDKDVMAVFVNPAPVYELTAGQFTGLGEPFQAIEQRETVVLALRELNARSQEIVTAFIECGDVQGAADRLYNDPCKRLELRMSSRECARKSVVHALRELSRRVDEEGRRM